MEWQEPAQSDEDCSPSISVSPQARSSVTSVTLTPAGPGSNFSSPRPPKAYSGQRQAYPQTAGAQAGAHFAAEVTPESVPTSVRNYANWQKIAAAAAALAAVDGIARGKNSFAARGARNARDFGKWLWNGSERGRSADARAHLSRNKKKYIAGLILALLAGWKRQPIGDYMSARLPGWKAPLNVGSSMEAGAEARRAASARPSAARTGQVTATTQSGINTAGKIEKEDGRWPERLTIGGSQAQLYKIYEQGGVAYVLEVDGPAGHFQRFDSEGEPAGEQRLVQVSSKGFDNGVWYLDQEPQTNTKEWGNGKITYDVPLNGHHCGTFPGGMWVVVDTPGKRRSIKVLPGNEYPYLATVDEINQLNGY